jgi:hypothetical protein
MHEGHSVKDQALTLNDREFSILLPTLALVSGANSRAMELGGGFRWGENGWQLHWPDEVAQGFGLRPSHVHKDIGQNDAFKVLFEPLVTERPNYWSTLFDLTAPALVISYEASSDEPPIIAPKDEEWLHWPWQVSDDEKIAALEKAIAAHEDLADQVDWVALAMRAGTNGPRSILFKNVTDYLQKR